MYVISREFQKYQTDNRNDIILCSIEIIKGCYNMFCSHCLSYKQIITNASVLTKLLLPFIHV